MALRTVILGVVGAALLIAGSSTAQDRGEQTPYERSAPRADVRVYGKSGTERIELTATRARIDALVRLVARECNREIVGLDVLSRNPEVTAKLVGEDLRDAMRFIGGSVGLRIVVTTSQIKVDEDLTPYPDRSELFARAATGYFRALVDYPESTLAPSAAWNRARIEQATPGRELEAARAFDDLANRYRKSDLVPEALLQAGIMFGKANAWDEATARFDSLAGYPTYRIKPAGSRVLAA